MSESAEDRRQRRAGMEIQVFRPGDEEAAADYDALYWDRIPVDERAAFVWELSIELWQLAHPESEPHATTERRPTRSFARAYKR